MKMTPQRMIGIALVIIGLVALMSGGFRWTQRKTVLDAGPLEITRQEHHGVTVPPILGVVSLVGGIILLAVPSRRTMRS
jgi:uncharacterized membrane protein HdeD (DUF308 family)